MNSRIKILEMLSEKKITPEEAEKLLALVDNEQDKFESKDSKGADRSKNYKYLRVVVKTNPNSSYQANGESRDFDDEDENVNVRIPISLLRAGMKLTSIIPPSAYNQMDSSLKEKGINFDLRNIKPENIEDLINALEELEVNVESKNKRKNTTVRIYAE